MRLRRLIPLAAAVALPAAAIVPFAVQGGAANAGTSPGILTGADLARLGAPATGIAGPDSPGSFDATLPNGRRVTPAGVSVQVGQNPLNSVLTPDGRYLVTSNDDERNGPSRPGTAVDPLDTKNGADTALSSYAITITDTATMKVVASLPAPKRLAPPNPGTTSNGRLNSDASNGLFLGIAVLPAHGGGYTVYASGGVSDVLYKYAVGADGTVADPLVPAQIPMPVPTDKTQATYGMAAPGWLTVSSDKKTLYVVNNNGNSVTPVALATDTPGTPVPVGYFPYAAQQVGEKLFVSNWGVTTRTFADGTGATDPVTGLVTHTYSSHVGGGSTDRFANPATSATKSSSLSVLSVRGGLSTGGSISLARPIDGLSIVGGTHPSALAYAAHKSHRALFVADANEDAIAVVDPSSEKVLRRVLLHEPVHLGTLATPTARAPAPTA